MGSRGAYYFPKSSYDCGDMCVTLNLRRKDEVDKYFEYKVTRRDFEK